MKLSERLSPKGDEPHISDLRLAGRFGYQMCTEAIAFSQNVPQRLLLADQLQRLPKIIHDLLKKQDIRTIVLEELRDVGVKQGAMHEVHLRKKEFNDIKREIFKADEALIRGLVSRTAEILGALAKTAYAEASGLSTDSGPTPFSDLKSQAAELPAHWFTVLDILLPHIEQKIWLTDICAPLPAHAVTRMHDQWSLFILFWCWTERQRFERVFEREVDSSTSSPVALHGAFYTDFFGIAVVDSWRDVAGRHSDDQHQVAVVLGPMFFTEQTVGTTTGEKKPHFFMARYFQIYLRLASELSNDWSHVDDATPTTEELMDYYQARVDLDAKEFDIRAKSVQCAWHFLRNIEIPDSCDLTRTDWEACALLAVWAARWRDTLKQVQPNPAATKWVLTLPDWERSMDFQLGDIGFPPRLALRLSRPAESVCTALKLAKDKFLDLDIPSVTWNRFRERQAASWAAQISAVNNLMHRMSTRVDAVETDLNAWKAPDFLMGFGARLCRYIASISHAHGVVLYWNDYAQSPARLRVLESYAKPYEHRAKRSFIHLHFDKEAYQPDDVSAACHMREAAKSMVYRCAATNQYDLPRDMSSANVMLSGFTKAQVPEPQSKMAVPIRVHGRVIGVMELLGFAPGQFAKQLRAPLRRISAQIGPVLYQTILLHQLKAIDAWVVALPPGQIEQRHKNPLEKLSALLCNVFLCPMVHVWYVSSNRAWYDLLGSNDTEMFKWGSGDSGHRWAPRFQIDPINPAQRHADRPFAELALALWGAYPPDQPERWAQVPKGFAGADGLMVKGLFRAACAQTRYYEDEANLHDEPNGKDTRKILLSATSRGIVLGQDFVASTTRPYRQWLFKDRRLAEVAAFAMVREAVPLITDKAADTPDPTLGTMREVIGVITLHDYGDSKQQRLDIHNKPVDQTHPERAQKISSYGSGWAPVVAHMQVHLPAVFQQIRLLKDPFNLMRSTFVHEAQHEISQTAGYVDKLDRQLHFALRGGGYKALRKLLDTMQSGVVDQNAQGDCHKLLSSLESAATSTDYLNLLHQQQRLERLHARLAGGDTFMALRLPSNEPPVLLPLRKSLFERVKAFSVTNARLHREPQWRRVVSRQGAEANRSRDVYAEWDRDGPDIMVVPSIWDHVVMNLLDNMDKYTPDHMPWIFQLEPQQLRLTIANRGRYDPEQDSAELHMRWGDRGRLVEGKSGTGLGLPFARDAAAVLGIELRYNIDPTADAGFALYTVTLDLKKVWHHAIPISLKGVSP